MTALVTLQALPEKQAAAQVSEMMLMSSNSAPSATTATSPVEGWLFNLTFFLHLIIANTFANSTSEDGVTEKMKEIFTSPYNRRALFIGLGLVLFQQVRFFS